MISVISHANIKPASSFNNIININNRINNKHPRHNSAFPLSILHPESLEVVRENNEIEVERNSSSNHKTPSF